LPAISTKKGGIQCKKVGINWKMTTFHSFSTVVAKLPPNATILWWHLSGIEWKFEHKTFFMVAKGWKLVKNET
jgi:hypothetical protein